MKIKNYGVAFGAVLVFFVLALGAFSQENPRDQILQDQVCGSHIYRNCSTFRRYAFSNNLTIMAF